MAIDPSGEHNYSELKSNVHRSGNTVVPVYSSRLRRVMIECLDANECIKRYDRKSTFFYLDPPYWGKQKYELVFDQQDYERLADSLRRIKGTFLMTLNDVEPIRRIFSDFNMETTESGYFIANTRNAQNARPKQNQLLIHNLK